MTSYRRRGKRLVDLALAVPALVLLSPLLAGIALLLRISLGPPVLFRQQRGGWQGRLFTLLKFRTMTGACDAQGDLLPDAERLTALGRFLRRTSLDELPELFNVMRGEMSLVGPRPLYAHYLDLYTPEQMRRHEVKPGITGWAQVNGRNTLSWEGKFDMDVWYVDHLSFSLDARIVVMTIRIILNGEGISQPGQATAEEFTGSGSR